LIDEEYAGNTIKVLISHLKNYLEEKGTKFKQEEWKVLYNSTNKYIDETDQAEAPSFSREQLDNGFSKLNVDSPFSVILRLYITFAVAGMLRTSSGYENYISKL
jgi:hypothetical protein